MSDGAVVRGVAADRRAMADVGRVARLELVFAVRQGRTILSHAYAEPPFRVGRCFDDGRGVHLILASSAPGVFGGDRLSQHVVVGRGAQVRLTTQSAVQLHPSPSGAPAVLDSRFEVEDEASLSCTWDPSIPFADAVIEQRIDIALAATGRVFWSDALMGGREGSGERWRFRSLFHQLRLHRSVHRAGQEPARHLAYLERYRIEPASLPPSAAWVAGNGAYAGTILRAGHGDTVAEAESVQAALSAAARVRGGADVLDADVLLVRVVAEDGVAFHRARHAAVEALRRA
jgi:urease accessory protein